MKFGGDSTVGNLPCPVDLALDQLSVSLDHLVKLVEDGGLDGLDDAGLIGFLQGFEQVRNRLPLVDHRAISDATRRQRSDALCQTNMARVLAVTVRISMAEAARRVRAAEAVGERSSMLGVPSDQRPACPVHPVVVARPRHTQDSTHQADLGPKMLRLLRLDAVDVYRSARRAKKASAFPKISSSSSLRDSSRSSRAILAWSDSAGGSFADSRRGARRSAARAQLATVVADRLNSFAKSMKVRLSRRCSSTIWSLNSWEYDPIGTPFRGQLHHCDGVRETGARPNAITSCPGSPAGRLIRTI